MPGFYHVVADPTASAALDGDADPDADEDDGSGTASQQQRRARARKFRCRAIAWLIAKEIAWASPVRWNFQKTQLILETEQAIPAVGASIEALFVLKNADLAGIQAFLAANAGSWT